jgi:hypothetical protein
MLAIRVAGVAEPEETALLSPGQRDVPITVPDRLGRAAFGGPGLDQLAPGLTSAGLQGRAISDR